MSPTADRNQPIKTIDMHYAGRTVALPDLGEYAKFYGQLAGGSWEMPTFRTLAQNLDRDTVFVDIGAWIGVTPMWSAQSAKAVIAVEPDPQCVAILRSLAATVPNVTILEGALSPYGRVFINAVDGFGSSETSVLDIGNGEQASVRGVGIDEIMVRVGNSPSFVKIDIEGYEFEIAREIAKLRNYLVRGAQIAIHPQLYEKTLKGSFLWRRLRTAWATWRLGKLFDGFMSGPRLATFDSLAAYVIRGVLLRGKPRGADFVYERDPASTGKD